MDLKIPLRINWAWCTRGIYRYIPTFLLTTVLASTIIISTPKHSFSRYACVPIFLYLSIALFNAGAFDMRNSVGVMDWSFCGYGLFLHLNSLILLDQIDATDPVISKPHNGQRPDYLVRLWRGLSYCVNLRMINTPYQIKNVPEFDPKRPGWVPSRRRFLINNSAWLIGLCLLYDMAFASTMSPEDVQKFLGVNRENLVFRHPADGPVTGDEIGFRIIIALTMWGLMIPAAVILQYVVFAVIAVGTGISAPRNWPPAFGNPKDSYTLRLFWGKLWHQTFRYHFSKPASFLTHDVLRLPKTGLVQRYTNIFFVFFLSGIMHAGGSYQIGLGSKGMSREMLFFCSMAVLIMIEDGVQWLFKSQKVRNGEEKEGFVLWKRIVGYIWVWGLIILMVPIIDFAKMRLRLPTWLPVIWNAQPIV